MRSLVISRCSGLHVPTCAPMRLQCVKWPIELFVRGQQSSRWGLGSWPKCPILTHGVKWPPAHTTEQRIRAMPREGGERLQERSSCFSAPPESAYERRPRVPPPSVVDTLSVLSAAHGSPSPSTSRPSSGRLGVFKIQQRKRAPLPRPQRRRHTVPRARRKKSPGVSRLPSR